MALLPTLNGSNYPCLELIFIVPKVFQPLKFYCIYLVLLFLHIVFLVFFLDTEPSGTSIGITIGVSIAASLATAIIVLLATRLWKLRFVYLSAPEHKSLLELI